MNTSHCLLAIAALITCNLTAETIILKTGTKYKGKIISQNIDSYLVEIHYSKTIKDERRIPKDQIQQIIRDPEDAEAINKVRALIPSPSLLPESAYNQRIKIAKDFLTKFPESKHTNEVKKILATLETERQTIKSGGLKIEGQLIPASNVETNAYDIHARVLFIGMKQLADRGKNLHALRKWEAIKKQYPHSAAFLDSMPIATRIVKSYTIELQRLLNTLESRQAKRKSALQNLNENDRQRTLDLLDEKSKKHETLIEKEKKQLHLSWLTTDPFHKKSLEYNLRSTQTAAGFLSNYDSTNFKPIGPDYRAAWLALAKGNLEKAEELIDNLKSMRLPEKYTTPLIKMLTTKKADAEIEKARKKQEEKERLEKEAAEKAKIAAEAKNKEKSKAQRNEGK